MNLTPKPKTVKKKKATEINIILIQNDINNIVEITIHIANIIC